MCLNTHILCIYSYKSTRGRIPGGTQGGCRTQCYRTLSQALQGNIKFGKDLKDHQLQPLTENPHEQTTLVRLSGRLPHANFHTRDKQRDTQHSYTMFTTWQTCSDLFPPRVCPIPIRSPPVCANRAVSALGESSVSPRSCSGDKAGLVSLILQAGGRG